MQITAHGIKWDTDGARVALPSRATVEVDAEDYANDDCAVADALSDKFGWSVKSISSTTEKKEKVKIKVKKSLRKSAGVL